jgi:hypothetical protein
MREEKIFDISFRSGGQDYRGWVNPSDRLREDGTPSSYHVVLNSVFFANLSYADGNWVADEHRPAALVAAAGSAIESYIKSVK